MSAPNEGGPPRTGRGPAKVSPARNLAGLVVLVIAVVVGGLEIYANRQAQAAVSKLDHRAGEEEKDLATESEVETLIGRKADGPGVSEGSSVKKTYTWSGVFRRYRVQVEYLKGRGSELSLLNVTTP